mgnify:CR=1 FL=1|jgi:hypothetical protein
MLDTFLACRFSARGNEPDLTWRRGCLFPGQPAQFVQHGKSYRRSGLKSNFQTARTLPT